MKASKKIETAERILDEAYHHLDMSRSDIDFELGTVRGAAKVLAAMRGTYLATEIRRSAYRKAKSEQQGDA